MALAVESIEQALVEAFVAPPFEGRLSKDNIHTLTLDGDNVHVALHTGFPCQQIAKQWQTNIEQTLHSIGAAKVAVEFSWKVATHAPQGKSGEPREGIKNIIAVASGKGGVGKSTTAVNLALALHHEGARVGILDADIYGPSQPIMLGAAKQRPESKDQKSIEPVVAHGIQSMSIGYLVEPEQAMVWRGPMASGALQQLINDTRWDNLDYLIVDLPPGTGDIQLTLSQNVPLTAAVVVTTPQDIALADALKGIHMFEKVKVPVLGVVENMAVHICKNCGHEEHIFGRGGGERLAAQHQVRFLGALPLSLSIRELADSGTPTVAANPESPEAILYREVAVTTAASLASEPRFAAKIPTITITND
jgi:ATP-binding protein involved in chromosome partitioning